jgi:hypothetical protein
MLLAGALGGASAGAPTARAEEFGGIPLPKGIQGLPEPYEMTLGSTALKVYGFKTPLSVDEVRAFFEEALPQAGWRVQALPWQERQRQAAEELERTLKEHPETAADPGVQARQAKQARTAEVLRRQLYANRGGEHVIINISALEQDEVVFINRWSGPAAWLEAGAADPLSSSPQTGGSWPMTNVCCSQDSLAETELPRVLPTTIPAYPGARIVATNRTESGESRTAVLETTDGLEAVRAFYEKHMAYNGWEAIPEARTQVQDLWMYRTESQLCSIGASSMPAPSAGGEGAASGPRTIVTINVMDRPSFGAEAGL